MKKRYVIEDLCCANCANINFLTQKLTLDADDSRLDSILDETERIIKKIEPDCALVR